MHIEHIRSVPTRIPQVMPHIRLEKMALERVGEEPGDSIAPFESSQDDGSSGTQPPPRVAIVITTVIGKTHFIDGKRTGQAELTSL